ncbi:MAG: hypothetical protein A2X81_10905 [Desulfobacterales bacterium GWB2_56_26]|nr:MAG: hypothetical protein A2X81_10905 [Desulfobacterales bacterium GWB2_56_26]
MTQAHFELQTLLDTIRALRGPQGCPWDRRQTSLSLLKYLRSECDELHEAITGDDSRNMCEELGDLLYIIIMISEINKDLNKFELSDVLHDINEKLIRRHPHVFAGVTYENEEQLTAQWQAIKAEEKRKNTV